MSCFYGQLDCTDPCICGLASKYRLILRVDPWVTIKGRGKELVAKREAMVAEALSRVAKFCEQHGLSAELPQNNSIFAVFIVALTRTEADLLNTCQDLVSVRPV